MNLSRIAREKLEHRIAREKLQDAQFNAVHSSNIHEILATLRKQGWTEVFEFFQLVFHEISK